MCMTPPTENAHGAVIVPFFLFSFPPPYALIYRRGRGAFRGERRVSQTKETKRIMAIDRVKAYFRGYGMEDRILEFDVSSATVALAAEALGCAPQRIAKTLSFTAGGGRALLVVAAGDARIDNAKYKARFGTKAKMLSPEEAEALTGHAVGGVCPFAVNEGAAVYLDVSLRRFATVFPACGSANSAIELTIPELETHSGYAGWVDVCKGY